MTSRPVVPFSFPIASDRRSSAAVILQIRVFLGLAKFGDATRRRRRSNNNGNVDPGTAKNVF